MTSSAQENVIAAMIYSSIAKKYLELVKHEVQGDTKRFLNILISRLSANESDTIARIGNAESRQMFIDEIKEADTLQYQHIILQMIGMTQEQKDLAEKVIDGILKGEVIEFLEPENKY
jgi:hypothetical protein